MTPRHARWRRWAVRAAALLALGAATSVAVAWVCAARSGPGANWVTLPKALVRNGETRVAFILSAPGVQVATRLPGFGSHSEIVAFHARLTQLTPSGYEEPKGWSFDELPPPLKPENRWDIDASHRAGLPWPCVTTRMSFRMLPSPRTSADCGFVIEGAKRLSRVLPYRPMWTGLALNTLVYSFIWLALFVGWSNVRAALRGRGIPGCCPKCDFSLAGLPHPGCPECGWGRGA